MNFGIISSRANSIRQYSSGDKTPSDDDAYVHACISKAVEAFAEPTTDVIAIVSGGGSKGPESKAKSFAEKNSMSYTVITPRTKSRGPLAFPERNTSIASISDVLVIFWGGEDMYVATAISEAMFMNKPVMLFPI